MELHFLWLIKELIIKLLCRGYRAQLRPWQAGEEQGLFPEARGAAARAARLRAGAACSSNATLRASRGVLRAAA